MIKMAHMRHSSVEALLQNSAARRQQLTSLTLFIFFLTLAGPFWAASTYSGPNPESEGAGTITDLVVDPSNTQTVYAVSPEGGVFKTSDGGSSWKPVNSGLVADADAPFGRMYGVFIDPKDTQTLYAIAEDFLFKTTNGGASWNRFWPDIHHWAIDPKNTGTLYLATSKYRVMKTTNGGASWSPVNSGLPECMIGSIHIDPQNTQTLYAQTKDGLFKTNNGGTGWSPAKTGLPDKSIFSLTIDPKNTQTLYAQTEDGLFKTNNGGASWSPANSGLPLPKGMIGSLDIDPQNTQTLYLKAEDGLFKTSNGGASWSLNKSSAKFLSFHPYGGGIVSFGSPLYFDPKNSKTIYLITHNNALLKTTNGGDSWSLTSSVAGGQILCLAIDPKNTQTLYVGTDLDGVWKTTNGGRSWISVNRGLTVPHTQTFPITLGIGRTFYSRASSAFQLVSPSSRF